MGYILEGLIFTILAADMSGVQGRWARELGLPLGAIAESIWVVVPILFVAMAIPAVRKGLGRWQHFIHVAALGCIFLPILIFSSQTKQIPLTDFPNSEASKGIRERFQNEVMIVGGSGGTRAYLRNTLDRDEVERVIFELDPSTKPTGTESGRREVLTPAPHTTGHTDLP